jgi:hypothetical protein
MKRFIEGEDRTQVTLLPACLDDYVEAENPVRVVEVFVDGLDPEVSDGALQFGMAEEKLDGSEIPGPSVDQRRFSTPHRMGAVGRRVHSNRPHPGPDDPGVLPGRKMGRLRNAAWKEVLLRLQMGRRDPGVDRVPCLLGDFKLHRPLGLLLYDNRPRRNPSALDDIVDAKPDQIAPAQLAVDGEVEQCEFAGSMIQLQANPDGPRCGSLR